MTNFNAYLLIDFNKYSRTSIYKFLLINSLGKLEKYDLEGNFLDYEETGELKMLNNDHGYSFDGKNLFFSTGISEFDGHSSFIYMKSIDDNKIELLIEIYYQQTN